MNKLIKPITLFILTISFNTLAYVPSVESLFRNGNNEEIGNNTVVANFEVNRKLKEETASVIKDQPLKSAYKILIGNENEDRPRFIQLDYRDGILSDETLNKVNYRNTFSLKGLSLNSEQDEVKLFYSIMGSLLTNNSSLMMEFLDEINSKIKRNKSLINQEQLSLLNSYRYYLKEKKEDENSDENNPLKPTAEEQRKKVKELLNRGFLVESPFVKRVFENNKFYWDVTNDKIMARFDSETHQLKRLAIATVKGKIEIDCHNYILFGGGLEFPETIYFKDYSGQLFEVKMKKIISFKDNTSSFNKRLSDYEKEARQSDNKVQALIKPPFIL